MVNLASQRRQNYKIQPGRGDHYSNIRIHPIFVKISPTANGFIHGATSPLSKAIDTLERILQIHPVQGNLIIPPKCTEYTYGLNKGKCMSPLPSQSDYKCGEFGVIPLSYIGTREVCTSSYSSDCTTRGPDGPGLPNADYLLFVSAYSTCKCSIHVANITYSTTLMDSVLFYELENHTHQDSR